MVFLWFSIFLHHQGAEIFGGVQLMHGLLGWLAGLALSTGLGHLHEGLVDGLRAAVMDCHRLGRKASSFLGFQMEKKTKCGR